MLENEEQRHKQYLVRKWLAQQRSETPQDTPQSTEIAAGVRARQKSVKAIELAIDEFPAMLEHYREWRKANPGQKWTPDVWLSREHDCRIQCL